MSIRVKVTLTIIPIAAAIIVFALVTGMVFVQNNLEKTIENDMIAVADIADGLITAEIDLLKAAAAAVSRTLLDVPDAELQAALTGEVKAAANFMALTVLDHGGIVAAAGIAPAPAGFADSEYVKRAFAGEPIISTTIQDSSGALVFRVCVPMGARVLSATVPGLFFNDILNKFKVWETGHIFIDDAEGTVLANIREDWVLERHNVLIKAETDSAYERVAATVRRMVNGESGSGRFATDGRERICVFRPITGSRVGWSLGVVAPLGESPLQDARLGLLLVGAVCLILSVVAAVFASGVIGRPYKTIEAHDKLLHTVNEVAEILLRTETSSFEGSVRQCMDMVTRCAGAEKMSIWRNHVTGGELCCSQLYEWSEGAGLQGGRAAMKNVAYRVGFPDWEEKLSSGRSVNGAALVIPVFFRESFWGFVMFDDCGGGRVFSRGDENLLRSGGMLIASAILRDEMTHELVRAREDAVAGAEAKSSFLANMSHEMRTPLNAVIGLTEVALSGGVMDEPTRENLEKVHGSGVTLLSLINDILDISKIEAGKFELMPSEYDTRGLISDTAALNIVRIGSKPVTFNLFADEDLPRRLFGDELRIKQIFSNLLSNAFKYTAEGHVDWRVSCERDEDGGVWLLSSVSDTGVGIRPKDMAGLFSEYNRVNAKSTRRVESTGLGLSICKSLVEMMGGTISVKSSYGEGSVFSVRIRQELAPGLEREQSAELVRVKIPDARVLAVDDLQVNLDVARGLLELYGMQTDCVTSGPAAVELIQSGEVIYDAIFMDHMMPGMDGVEAVRLIREIGTDYAKNVPIIALTANAIAGSEDMFLKNGFQAFIPKPIDVARMDEVISRWVRKPTGGE
ncbi:hypothetical protein FACS18949_05830 [Clostridia bacterium]|nr:hypothetical protein FACS18949_05830 [Clostridia bacterium]